ncbi:uncharacterized protein LOC111352694 isoform X1 [Spodoptera litura]|uniref:Uncharacterized protein LOC111352694 isoform X1 n=2 Tax=Spodoptera litura TaxID=69820 RepID=A0A9J7DZC5_SPOLT|nr:uncharacterized protein LOC111352694 isoform X1 [Spodoptera litura]
MEKKLPRPVNTSYYNTNYHYTNVNKEDGNKMHGSRRVITFCLLTTILPSILIVLPLYLRNIKYADVMYKISDSDVIQIHKGQSSIFCEKHSLKMNTTFSAFQMKGTPEISNKRKHIRLKKSMTLLDDTLEYWGFYLLKGAAVELKACSQHKGSKILVVKGDRILNTCGILDGYNRQEKGIPKVEHQGLLVTLENPDKKNEENNTRKHLTHNNEENKLDGHDSSQSILHTKGTTEKKSQIVQERAKRDIKNIPLHNPNTLLDTGVYHGGNAFNSTVELEEPVSRFENTLNECFHDMILINRLFPFSVQCNSTNYLENTTTLKVVHEVLLDGYYYYIFYSDSGINDIHAIFDIYKPTFQYVNNSESKVCVNRTECEFNIDFFSDELVIVEKPTKEGLQNEESDSSILVSVCHPRMSIYIFFPISVILLILLFAFL